MAHTLSSIADKRRAFRKLHESGCFLIPNPWDTGTARYLQGLGFKALATTSSGFGWSKGRPDAAKPAQALVSPPPAHADLAARVSIRRESVTRELKALERAGLLEKRRGAMVLTDTARLRKMIAEASELE